MDGRSETNLIGVYPALADKVRDAADVLAKQDIFILVVSGLRTREKQQALYDQGRIISGDIVTNAKPGFSLHNYGLACDIVPYLVGDSGALNWDHRTAQYGAMVSQLKAQGLTWGGEWHMLKDYDHFQFGGLPASPSMEMVADYGDGGLDALKSIWANVAAGKYAL